MTDWHVDLTVSGDGCEARANSNQPKPKQAINKPKPSNALTVPLLVLLTLLGACSKWSTG
jgi:hypothetical protein